MKKKKLITDFTINEIVGLLKEFQSYWNKTGVDTGICNDFCEFLERKKGYKEKNASNICFPAYNFSNDKNYLSYYIRRYARKSRKWNKIAYQTSMVFAFPIGEGKKRPEFLKDYIRYIQRTKHL